MRNDWFRPQDLLAEQAADSLASQVFGRRAATEMPETAAPGAVVSGQIVVTVPAPGRLEHSETVAAASVTAAHRLLLSLGAHADSDENSAEMLGIDAMEGAAGTGSITATLAFAEPTSGPIRLNYLAV